MSACSQERRKLGLAYPRTCQRCALGPCSVFPPIPPGPPPNQGSGGSRPSPPMNEDIKRLVEELRIGLQQVDAVEKSCPVRSSRRMLDKCPDCGATTSQSCGQYDRASYRFVESARQALASLTTKETDQ